MTRRKMVEVLPAQGLPVAALQLDLAMGEHPAHAACLTSLHRLNAMNLPSPWYTLNLPIQPLVNGHHMVRDEGYLAAAGHGEDQTDSWPLAPVFVRDVAGRVVHTGFNPLPVRPGTPLMPSSCQYVAPNTPGYELLERTFLTCFRKVEWLYGRGAPLTGRPHVNVTSMYTAPQQYPYKLRVDSFYQDGFRLPQVERLLVLSAEEKVTEALGSDLLERWQARPTGQGYMEFYEAQQGDTWFEELFAGGCTVVPTFEAANGNFKVGKDYTLEDAWPGCVVAGLHDVVEYKPDTAPAGTILDVVRPGYATQHVVVPARVVASDGSGYVSPFGDVPEPMQPNPALPHPRVGSFEGVWLPTHPGHFELPALWDWNEGGHFQQVAGPLWDPVHYTYTSTPGIIRAFRTTPTRMPDMAPVPEDMLNRFHPTCGLTTYDTCNMATLAVRVQQAGASPLYNCSLDTVPMGRPVCGVGYHSLPTALEYELDPFMFPHLGPRHVPTVGASHIAPVAGSTVTVAEAKKLLVAMHEPTRQLWQRDVNFKADNPLLRYQTADMPSADATLAWCYVPHVSTSELMVNVKRFFLSKAYVNKLKEVHPDLYRQFFEFREAALAWRRLRHRLIRKYPGWYMWLWWFGHSPDRAEQSLADNPAFMQLEAERLLRGQLGVVIGTPEVTEAA